ncbi:MAG: hypothetical protein PHQ03_10190 [Methylococcales bacterium]|nr:hypothetical protein [Methylococcales bacterium]
MTNFCFADVEYDDSTRALVIDLGQPLGFVVDKVAQCPYRYASQTR